MTATKKPRGWFTRSVRKVLEPLWDEQYMTLGLVDRWETRDAGWEEVKESVGIGGIMQLAHEGYCRSEGQILTSNQNSFRSAVADARTKLTSQGILPFSINGVDPSVAQLIEQEIRTHLAPIKEVYLRKPGSDQDFSKLISVADVDFDVVYDMVVVRDENQKKTQFSQEDYEFLDSARRALKASNRATLGQVFNLYKSA